MVTRPERNLPIAAVALLFSREGEHMIEVERLLSRAEVTRMLEVLPAAVTAWYRRGKLPYVRTALGRLYRREDVERLRGERERREARRHAA